MTSSPSASASAPAPASAPPSSASASPSCCTTDLTSAELARWPLPAPPGHGDKESRGHVLVIGGSREMPGAVLLAGRAALRAGAGKLAMAVPASVARGVALQIPEARVIALPETPDGGLAIEGVAQVAPQGSSATAVLLGPGMLDKACIVPFVRQMLPSFTEAVVVLDALGMEVVRDGNRFAQPVVMTPHAGELAGLTGTPKAEVRADPQRHALEAARQWGATVVLKGATTCIMTPDGRCWRHHAEVPGLATSGSGDVLAGTLAGIAARGAAAEHAAAWAVAAHACAGAALAERHGRIGYLASEICDMLPQALARMPGACG